jgi:hypothetical protein
LVAGIDVELLEVEPVPGGGSSDGTVRIQLVVSNSPHAVRLALDADVSDGAHPVGNSFSVTTDSGGAALSQHTLFVEDMAAPVVKLSR